MMDQWLHKTGKFLKTLPSQKGLLVMILTAILIAIDIIAPPQYMIEYLYIIPVFISLSLLSKRGMFVVLFLVILATLSDFFMPASLQEWNVPFIFLSRLIVILFLVATAFFFFYRNRYKERIQDQEKRLSEAYHLAELREGFIATLSHDLKTPLLGGQKILQYFSEGMFGKLTEEQKAAIETLLRGNTLELELIETLLTIYRNDNLGVDIQSEAVNINELIQDVISQCQYMGLEQGITLNYLTTPSHYTVRVDKIQIQRVIFNLLHNAFNYAPPSSEIQVQLGYSDNFISVIVQDQGPGLPTEDLKNIFLRFYQVESDQRPMLSSGLGLYLARQIVQAHNGEIWAENIAPKGFQIRFTIPCLNQHSPSHVQQSTALLETI